MNMELLRQELERDEGVRYQVYGDTMHLRTAGIGHQSPDLPPVGTPVTYEQIEAWYEADVAEAIKIAKSYLYGIFYRLTDTRQRAIVNLAFNMGNNLKQFKNMQRAIYEGDWKDAAYCLESSLWWSQVGQRGPRIRDMLLNG